MVGHTLWEPMGAPHSGSLLTYPCVSVFMYVPTCAYEHILCFSPPRGPQMPLFPSPSPTMDWGLGIVKLVMPWLGLLLFSSWTEGGWQSTGAWCSPFPGQKVM